MDIELTRIFINGSVEELLTYLDKNKPNLGSDGWHNLGLAFDSMNLPVIIKVLELCYPLLYSVNAPKDLPYGTLYPSELLYRICSISINNSYQTLDDANLYYASKTITGVPFGTEILRCDLLESDSDCTKQKRSIYFIITLSILTYINTRIKLNYSILENLFKLESLLKFNGCEPGFAIYIKCLIKFVESKYSQNPEYVDILQRCYFSGKSPPITILHSALVYITNINTRYRVYEHILSKLLKLGPINFNDPDVSGQANKVVLILIKLGYYNMVKSIIYNCVGKLDLSITMPVNGRLEHLVKTSSPEASLIIWDQLRTKSVKPVNPDYILRLYNNSEYKSDKFDAILFYLGADIKLNKEEHFEMDIDIFHYSSIFNMLNAKDKWKSLFSQTIRFRNRMEEVI